jgi:hypothetical protein
MVLTNYIFSLFLDVNISTDRTQYTSQPRNALSAKLTNYGINAVLILTSRNRENM